jgi:hypothetical protein
MTGSRKGLEALTSTNGYEHLSKKDLEASANRGCRCCAMLWATALKMNKMWKRAETWDPKVVALDTFDEHILSLPGSKLQKLSSLRYTRRAEPGDGKAFFDIFVSADRRKCLILRRQYFKDHVLNLI